MKKIIVVSGASSGMGKEFAIQIGEKIKADEIWVLARRLDKLEELKEILPLPVVCVALDLSDGKQIEEIYQKKLEEEKPEILLLANISGYGLFGHSETLSNEKVQNMIDLNCKAVVSMVNASLPYLTSGSKILNLASTAAYQPIPYINVYAATKAFVLSYSRALNQELKYRNIHVLAVTPFWVKTAFFDRAINKDEKPVVTKYTAMYDPKKVIKKAIKDLDKKKDVSCYGFMNSCQRFLVTHLPKKWVMAIWMRQQKLDGTPANRK